jgi:hypothetical protein
VTVRPFHKLFVTPCVYIRPLIEQTHTQTKYMCSNDLTTYVQWHEPTWTHCDRSALTQARMCGLDEHMRDATIRASHSLSQLTHTKALGSKRLGNIRAMTLGLTVTVVPSHRQVR